MAALAPQLTLPLAATISKTVLTQTGGDARTRRSNGSARRCSPTPSCSRQVSPPHSYDEGRFVLPPAVESARDRPRDNSPASGFVVRYDHRGETGVGEATPLPGWTESLDDCQRGLDDAATVAAGGGHQMSCCRGRRIGSCRPTRLCDRALDADARADGVPLYQWFDSERHAIASRSTRQSATGLQPRPPTPSSERLRPATIAVRSGREANRRRRRGARSDRPRAGGRRRDPAGRRQRRVARDRAQEAFDRLAPLDVAYVERHSRPMTSRDVPGFEATGSALRSTSPSLTAGSTASSMPTQPTC